MMTHNTSTGGVPRAEAPPHCGQGLPHAAHCGSALPGAGCQGRSKVIMVICVWHTVQGFHLFVQPTRNLE